MFAAPKAPSLRGLSAKLTGGVYFLGRDTPSGSSSHLPQRGRQGAKDVAYGKRGNPSVSFADSSLYTREAVGVRRKVGGRDTPSGSSSHHPQGGRQEGCGGKKRKGENGKPYKWESGGKTFGRFYGIMLS